MSESWQSWADAVKFGGSRSLGRLVCPGDPNPRIQSCSTGAVETADNVADLARLSCFHGANGKKEEAILDNWSKATYKPIQAFYSEAVRRLPVAEMPELIECLLRGGYCIGFLDPVSNIILNALNYLRRRPEKKLLLDLSGRSINWALIATMSYAGLIAFIRVYFRYVSAVQAMRYIHLAGADLAVAIRLAELEQYGVQHRLYGVSSPSAPDLCSDRAQFALKYAAIAAQSPVPDDLLLLFRPLLLSSPEEITLPLQALLEKGRVLSVDDVGGILKFLSCQQQAATPTVQVSFWRRPQLHQCGRKEHLQCPIGNNQIAEVCVRPMRVDEPFSIARMRSSQDIRTRLASCLGDAAMYNPRRPRNLGDVPPTCKYITYVKMCLVDTIHAFYLKAIALLPRNGLRKHLLRGLLVSGHCYGLMDPVSNIILNSVWYDLAFPNALDDSFGVKDGEDDPGVLDITYMLRMEVRSVEGLVVAFRAATGYSEHMAVECICSMHCDLSAILHSSSAGKRDMWIKFFGDAGQAAKHPRHKELASFLASLASEKFKLNMLRSLLNSTGEGSVVMADANLEQVYRILSIVPTPRDRILCPEASCELVSRRAVLGHQQRFLRIKLEKLLHCHADQHPWEPIYELDVICGVMEIETSPICYHINFLASHGDASTTSVRMIFFAQVWGSDSLAKLSDGYEEIESERSFCCRLPHYNTDRTHLGRCSMCEPGLSKIVHPLCGIHVGAIGTDYTQLGGELDSICRRAERAVGFLARAEKCSCV